MSEHKVNCEKWDNDQIVVIEAGGNQRLLVEAGPGTGKTSVACARIAYLVENQGIEESNIWMISYTRTAVAEIRSRLKGYVGELAYSIKVATVDSHAWSIHSGHNPDAKLTGTYEETIDQVIQMIQSDEDVQDELKYVEHLVVDEAQDIVGNRCILIDTLIRHLESECGVTVFADSAQAIYGFSEDTNRKGAVESITLVNKLMVPQTKFRKKQLKTVHRTSSPGLKRIFTDVRNSILTGINTKKNIFVQTSEDINKFSDQSGLNSNSIKLDNVPENSLVLFRSRVEALMSSQFCQRPHRLRLSGFGMNLPPWIAICFWDYKEQAISFDFFVKLWEYRVEHTACPDYSSDEAWNLLFRVAGNMDGSVNLRRLRACLSRKNPPIDLCRLDFGLTGPIIGTIHASKGREADQVTMLIPRQGDFDDPFQEAEETRILFVGATRAREELRVGKALVRYGTKLEGERSFRIKNKNRKTAMVEIGCPGDLSISGLAGRKIMTGSDFNDSQNYLKKHASDIMNFELRSVEQRNWRHVIVDPEIRLPIGVMSKSLNNDLWKIGKKFNTRAKKGLRPNSIIKAVRAHGSQTIVVSEDDPKLETLLPQAQTGFFLAPMIAAFTNVYYN